MIRALNGRAARFDSIRSYPIRCYWIRLNTIYGLGFARPPPTAPPAHCSSSRPTAVRARRSYAAHEAVRSRRRTRATSRRRRNAPTKRASPLANLHGAWDAGSRAQPPSAGARRRARPLGVALERPRELSKHSAGGGRRATVASLGDVSSESALDDCARPPTRDSRDTRQVRALCSPSAKRQLHHLSAARLSGFRLFARRSRSLRALCASARLSVCAFPANRAGCRTRADREVCPTLPAANKGLWPARPKGAAERVASQRNPIRRHDDLGLELFHLSSLMYVGQ